MPATVHVTGLRETVRALDKINRDAKKTVLAELAQAAEPMAADARASISRYQGASLATIKPLTRVRGVFLAQTKRKVTGRRADFGALQMQRGLWPAVERHADELEPRLGRALERLAQREGF